MNICFSNKNYFRGRKNYIYSEKFVVYNAGYMYRI